MIQGSIDVIVSLESQQCIGSFYKNLTALEFGFLMYFLGVGLSEKGYFYWSLWGIFGLMIALLWPKSANVRGLHS